MPTIDVMSLASTMPTLRRRHRHAAATGKAPLRSTLADAAWAVEDRVALSASDFFHRAVEVMRWPLERAAWAVENWLVWPIQEETAGWSKTARAGVVAALVLLALGGIAAGIAASSPSSGEESPVVSSNPATTAAKAEPQAQVEAAPAAGPTLHGAELQFSQESGGGIPASERADAAAKAQANEGVAAVSPKESGAAKNGGAAVAGPEAIEVARRFAGAFVLYETGRTDAKVRQTFSETATPELEQALLKRPPRLPAGVKVPEAKVLNIVSGPKSGSTYTLSVSLLRVGVTSELRIDMEKGEGRWSVTDVRG